MPTMPTFGDSYRVDALGYTISSLPAAHCVTTDDILALSAGDTITYDALLARRRHNARGWQVDS